MTAPAAPTPSPDQARAASAEPPGPAPAAAEPEGRRKNEHIPGFRIDCESPVGTKHVGIVFVHGIGSQAAGETLLDWSSKLIGLLIDARSIAYAKGETEIKGDPVIDCQLDPGPGGARYIELQLPKSFTPDGEHEVPEQHWVMTEAWWAERVRPPSFADMADWLGPRGAVRRIVMAMLPRGTTRHDARLRPYVQPQSLKLVREEIDTLHEAVRRRVAKIRHRDIEPLRDIVQEVNGGIGDVYGGPRPGAKLSLASDIGTLFLALGAGLYFQAISALVLILYGALRSIEKLLPIGPLKDGALTRPIDRFVLEWFGDVFVLLRDPAQSASVRGRLIEAIRDLQWNDCDPIVVVAHSGGAIVSYMTLADERLKGLQVDRLVTLGEGLNLAWRLIANEKGSTDAATRARYDRLYEDLLAVRECLKWDDFWASADPAPVGTLSPEPDVFSAESLKRIQSHAVWNRLSTREDHGAYWDNDEEFLIPLARLIDSNPEGHRDFIDSKRDNDHSRRRRRRLTFLSIWRQLGLIAPTAAIVMSYLFGSTAIATAGRQVADIWSKLPGNTVISDPVRTIRDMKLQNDIGWSAVAEAGIWVIIVVLGLVALVALLPPSERPVPWNDRRKPWWQDFNPFANFLRFVPFVVAVPVAGAILGALVKFWIGATKASVIYGQELVVLVVATALAAGAGYLIFGDQKPMSATTASGDPADTRWRARAKRWREAAARHARDGIELGVTIEVMAVVGFVTITPVVSVLVYEDVGTMVLGMSAIIVAFQLLGRIGTWRWMVWDDRERVSIRMGDQFPSLVRIVVQMTLLLATVFLGFAGVVVGDSSLVVDAVIGAGLAVLLGVAVDVMDVARGARRSPGDALARGTMNL